MSLSSIWSGLCDFQNLCSTLVVGWLMNLILKHIKSMSLINTHLVLNLQILAMILQVWSHRWRDTKLAWSSPWLELRSLSLQSKMRLPSSCLFLQSLISQTHRTMRLSQRNCLVIKRSLSPSSTLERGFLSPFKVTFKRGQRKFQISHLNTASLNL